MDENGNCEVAMPLRDWIFGKADPVAADRKRTINELSEFMKLLAEADGLTLGMAAAASRRCCRTPIRGH
jgi:hypothetical protein